MSDIIKTKFLCKKSSSISSRLHPTQWINRFVEGKWYDGEYEKWSFERGFKINGGWRRYWVINEKGDKEEINRMSMSTIFQLDIEELRDIKINEILNYENGRNKKY